MTGKQYKEKTNDPTTKAEDGYNRNEHCRLGEGTVRKRIQAREVDKDTIVKKGQITMTV